MEQRRRAGVDNSRQLPLLTPLGTFDLPSTRPASRLSDDVRRAPQLVPSKNYRNGKAEKGIANDRPVLLIAGFAGFCSDSDGAAHTQPSAQRAADIVVHFVPPVA